MFDTAQSGDVIGRDLRTTDGAKVGTIGHLYLDDYNNQPEWITVRTGLFGTNESFVPLADAQLTDDGVVVPYTKDQIKDAPNVSEEGHLSEDEERRLYEYYGVAYDTDGSTFARTGDTGYAAGDTGYAAGDTGYAAGDAGAVDTGRTTAATTGGDDAMTRSEQRLDVGTERVQTGTARLRKWVEQENVQVDVPVTREKARLVTEPVTDANRGDALSGPELDESEHEITLTEERPVVSKETVPVERVRLEKDVETDVRQVEETVGKERIEVDGDVAEDRTRR